MSNNTCHYQWSLITDNEVDNKPINLLDPLENYIVFEIYHDDDREHEVSGIVSSTQPLIAEDVKELVEEYSGFYGVPVPQNLDEMVAEFVNRRI